MIIAINRYVSPHSKNGSDHMQRVKILSDDILGCSPTKSHWIEYELVNVHFKSGQPSITVRKLDYEKMMELIEND